VARFFDVVIVGGGAAGLSAALTLGRCLRSVLVCDAGEPRNAPAKLFNGFLSRDGSNPGEFLQICRDQLQRYETVGLRSVTVTKARRHEKGFAVELKGGEEVECRLLLLATGIVDELPRIEGLLQFYGKTIHSCPHCHGWEVRGQPIAVVGGSQEAANLAIELRNWSEDVVLCADGALECDEKIRGQLIRNGVKVIEQRILRLEGQGEDLHGLRFEDGNFLERSALFFSPGQHQRSSIAESLGCEFCAEDGCIRCDKKAATCVPGLYAAGNASSGVQLVIAAAAEGTLAGVAMNNALIEADAESGTLGQ
jgi:thioredoxin reductase